MAGWAALNALLEVAFWLAILLAGAEALASCATCPGPRPTPVPGPPVPCLTTPPPAARTWGPRVKEGCPEGLSCRRDEDERQIASELEDRRGWDEVAWAGCARAAP